MNIKTRKQALATYWGCDIAEVEDYRYQPTKTSIPVYTSGDKYYCVTKNDKPATHRDGFDWNWKQVHDSLVEKYGWKIWVS